jgi:DNA-binding CsgD family transcriptional regulator
MRTGRQEQAAAHVAAMQEAGLEEISGRLDFITRACAALAAEGEPAGPLFEAALAVPGAAQWPFDLARVRLAYGEQLRRAHATAAARVQLAAAQEALVQLGARPWADRAAAELRACGGRGASPAAGLTSQEQEIAELAAAGLTNKQIGEQLFLSHRTVSTHLYRIFPKLGITSRAALRDALREHSGPLAGGQPDGGPAGEAAGQDQLAGRAARLDPVIRPGRPRVPSR